MPDAKAIAGVVIRDKDGKYLLVQEKKKPFNGLWGFPGGHVDEGETTQQAAIREAYEEVGLTVAIIDDEPLMVTQLIHHDKIYHAYMAKIISGELKIDDNELLNSKWLSLEEIIKLDKSDKTREPMILQAVIKAEKS